MTARERLEKLQHETEMKAVETHAQGMALVRLATTYELMARTLPEDGCERFLRNLAEGGN